MLNLTGCRYLRVSGKEQGRIENEEKNKELAEKAKNTTRMQDPKGLLESIQDVKIKDYSSTQIKDFEDSEKKFKISVPNNWTEIDKIKKNNPDVSIAVGDYCNSCYATLMYESKGKLSSGITLDEYNNTLIEKINKEEKNNNGAYDVKDIEINGYKAKTFLLNSTVDFQSRSRYAVIELPDNFVCVRTWSKADDWNDYMTTAQRIVSSFQSVGASK